MTTHPAVRNTKIIEAMVGVYTAAMSVWIWVGDAFTTVFPNLLMHAGMEPIVAVLGSCYGALQAYIAYYGHIEARAWMSLIMVFMLSLLTITVVTNQGWQVLGVGALLVTIILQAVIFLRLRLYLYV